MQCSDDDERREERNNQMVPASSFSVSTDAVTITIPPPDSRSLVSSLSEGLKSPTTPLSPSSSVESRLSSDSETDSSAADASLEIR